MCRRRCTINMFSGFTGSIFLLKFALHILAPTFSGLAWTWHFCFCWLARENKGAACKHQFLAVVPFSVSQYVSLTSSLSLFPLSLGLCKFRDTLLPVSYLSSGSLIFNFLCPSIQFHLCFVFFLSKASYILFPSMLIDVYNMSPLYLKLLRWPEM